MTASPGNMPSSLGDVWTGDTRWVGGPTPDPTVIGGGQPQSCLVDWPTNPWWVNPHAPVAPYVVQPSSTHYHFTPTPLSDADVDRIARRLAEILRESKP